MKKLLLIILAAGTLFSSCKKENTGTVSTNIYIAGYQWDSLQGNDASGVWKNANFTANTLPAIGSHYAYAMAVNGNDVFTTGYENTVAGWKCHVWKNGQKQYSLGDGYSVGHGIAISGNDVYVAGRAYESTPLTNYAMLWKNSSPPTILTSTNTHYTTASAVMVAGSDVYVAGTESGAARLWKNGTNVPLSNASVAGSGFEIPAMAVSGNDVYLVGHSNGSFIRYWKNGNSNDIPISTQAFATCIFINNNDVYIGGYEIANGKAYATYWKNGTAVRVGASDRVSFARGLAVSGNDVYVVGEQRDANNISDYAALWKNGQLSLIGSRNSGAKAIVIK
jgi:WD40 repeat protein